MPRPRGLRRCVPWALAAVAVVLAARAAHGGEEVQTIASVRGLAPDVVATNPAVRVRGVVTCVHFTAGLFIQDDTDAIYVGLRNAQKRGLLAADAVPADIRLGSLIEVEGILDPAGFAPSIFPRSVTVIGERPLPPARAAEPQRLFAGADACRRVTVTGIVQDAIRNSGGWWLTLETGGRRLLARIRPDVVAGESGALLNAVVRVSGPVGSVFNTRGEFLANRLYVEQRTDFEVVTPPPSPPFESPLESLWSLTRFRPDPLGGHMVRVRGTVIHAIPGEMIYLQSGAAGIRVTTRTKARFAAGDVVEAAGFVDSTGPVAGLAYGLVRVMGHEPPPAPTAITPAEILDINARAAKSFLPATPGDYESCLVRFPATLIDARPTADGGVLVLAAGETSVTAAADADAFATLRHVRPGSALDVTAVSHIEWSAGPGGWAGRTPVRLEAIIRGADDVVVVRPASWWTPHRLVTLAGAIAAVLAGTLAWVWLLRRELGVQKGLLAREIRTRHEAAVDVNATLRERNRLAANLHDTLLQTLGGIGYQLDACEGGVAGDSEQAREHFDIARRMVSHATSELHHSVWAMRSLPLGRQNFPEALQSMVRRVSEGHAVAIHFDLAGPLDGVPAFIAGNLLLIVQEAVYNALRHGHPRSLQVSAALDSASRTIRVRVVDDGSGFATAGASSAEQGHFGLQGMRERVARLSGALRVESEPGRGTTVTAEVPCRDYDADIDAPG